MFTIIKSTDDTDCTFAEIIYEEGKKAQDLAPDYIDTYVGTFENYEYPGTIEIGADGLSSEMVIASSDSQYVELYLVDLDSADAFTFTNSFVSVTPSLTAALTGIFSRKII